MIRYQRVFILVIILLFTSCRQDAVPDQVTPTPFSSTRNPLRPPLSESIPITLTNLAANPEFFEGATLQLTGEYQRLPVLACREEPHFSPATWSIVGESLLANATGHDAQLKSLLAINQPITVEGRWLRYIGPIGCGKSAPVQEIWYINVSRIISPHPLVRELQVPQIGTVVLTEIAPVPEGTNEAPPTETIQVAEVPTESFNEIPMTPTTEVLTPTETPPPSPRPTQGATAVTPSPLPTSFLTTTPIISATGTVTTTQTTTPDPNVTPGNSTLTPEPTASSSPSPGEGDFNNRGALSFEDLRISTLEAGDPDRWTLTIDNQTTITITAAPDSTANLVISIFDENGATILDSHNQNGQGQVETISGFSIEEAGQYHIEIENQSGTEADYALMALDQTSYSFIFKGNLTPSSPQDETLQHDNDHFWFFKLTNGDIISLRVTPNNQTDPYLELYDPNGTRIQAIDNTGTGETEILNDYEATSDGIYSIRVGEFDFAQMTYQILLTK